MRPFSRSWEFQNKNDDSEAKLTVGVEDDFENNVGMSMSYKADGETRRIAVLLGCEEVEELITFLQSREIVNAA